MNLTHKDIELARRYIIIRSAIKGLTHDKNKFSEGEFELGNFYFRLTENALVKANDELKKLRRYPLEVKVTEQPTVYEVKIGNRYGYIEINVVEIAEEIAKLFLA